MAQLFDNLGALRVETVETHGAAYWPTPRSRLPARLRLRNSPRLAFRRAV